MAWPVSTYLHVKSCNWFCCALQALSRFLNLCRLGQSPGVAFPRILGIEAVGVVADAPGTDFTKGDIVATAMGGMGRDFDGGYAEYTVVPAKQVQVSPQHLTLVNSCNTLEQFVNALSQ